MNIGTIIIGRISSIKSFGIFITFDNGFAFCHISELANDFIKDINELFKLGQEVKAKIIKIDDLGKINVSIKQVNIDDNVIKEKESTSKQFIKKTPKKNIEPVEKDPFELMMNGYLKASDSTLTSIKRRNKKHTKR